MQPEQMPHYIFLRHIPLYISPGMETAWFHDMNERLYILDESDEFIQQS